MDYVNLGEGWMRDFAFRSASWFAILLSASIVAGCGGPDPVTPDRYESSDRLIAVLEANVSESDQLEKIVTIDHSRLGAEAGSVMPPAVGDEAPVRRHRHRPRTLPPNASSRRSRNSTASSSRKGPSE